MPCMHIAFSHCFRWHFLFADKRAYPSEQAHPDSNESHPGYHQATGLAARPYSFMGNIPLHATGRRKIATTLQRVDGTLLCALIHPGPMLQVQLCNDDAGRTDTPHGNDSHLDTKHYGIDFRHRFPDSRLPSVQQAQG